MDYTHATTFLSGASMLKVSPYFRLLNITCVNITVWREIASKILNYKNLKFNF